MHVRYTLVPAGAGKSTLVTQLLIKLQTAFATREGNVLPIYCNLPTLTNPKTAALQEALEQQYKLSPVQINELKRRAQEGEVHLVILADSVDAMLEEFKHVNLYNTNDLEDWADPFVLFFMRA